ncbi:MAG: hypothetical protein K2K49_04395, partial [Duncaniella sp.]|nr:hypothetical protein [Duncaniella sp.]
MLLFVATYAGAVAPRVERCRHEAPMELKDTTLTIAVPMEAEEMGSLTIQASVALRQRPRPGDAKEYWSLTLLPSDITVTLRTRDYGFGDIIDRRAAMLTVAQGSHKLWQGEAADASTHSGVFNTLRLAISSDSLTVAAGSTLASEVCTIALPDTCAVRRVSLTASGRATLSLFALEAERSARSRLASGMTAEEIAAHLAASSDRMEAEWQYLDRNNDPLYARPGGEYRLATIADGLGGYHIVYLGGASVLPADWEAGMLKGHLAPTP